jgi:hypothetical protein
LRGRQLNDIGNRYSVSPPIRIRQLNVSFFWCLPKTNQFVSPPVLFELTTTNTSGEFESKHFSYNIPIDESRKKRTFEFPDLLRTHLDSSKILFPKGILSKITEGKDELPRMKRIELFANREDDTYGIIRTMSVALSREKSVLHIADASNGVIQVRTVRTISSTGRFDVECQMDTLILKRFPEANSETQLDLSPRLRVPKIIVPPRWKDRMKLSEGDCLLISNPIAEFAVPPPNV